MDTHVCLVSAQPVPNLTPFFAPGLACRRAVLLASDRMAAQAHSLATFLSVRNIDARIVPVPDTHDLPGFRQAVAGVLEGHPGAGLNATGGLKPMSLAAFEIFRQHDRPVWYVETDNRVLWLHPADRPDGRIAGVLGIADYFEAFGEGVASRRDEPLADDHGLGCLQQPERLEKPGHGDHERRGEKFESLVFRAARAALEDAGGDGVRDVCWALRTRADPADEFDVVAVRHNTLFLVEAKLGRQNDFNTFINKLENLRNHRGITARAALISAQPVVADGGHAQRARRHNILLLGQADLPGLQQRLGQWFRKS